MFLFAVLEKVFENAPDVGRVNAPSYSTVWKDLKMLVEEGFLNKQKRKEKTLKAGMIKEDFLTMMEIFFTNVTNMLLRKLVPKI